MASPVRVVHLIAKTHLDLGFTGLASEVADRYVNEFFPRSIEVAAALRQRGGSERLVWTTGSWILHHALGAASKQGRVALIAAIERGDLAWHALPVTTHTELMDVELVRSGLGISAELDGRFGRTTTAAKMTDVPGHTRGLVPLLAEAGVTFLHLGVNPAWPVPDVPPVFRWRSPDGASVVVAYQAGGYGGVVEVPGCDEVLVFLHSGDNLGPPTVNDVLAAHADLRHHYRHAEVRASTLDAFARAVANCGPAIAALPEVTAEIGDSWIFGVGSDPQKVAAYRGLLRERRGMDPSAEVTACDRALLLVAEHTWGLDQKEALPDTEHWDRAGLTEIRGSAAVKRFETSWDEQRGYVDAAADALGERWDRSSGALSSVATRTGDVGPIVTFEVGGSDPMTLDGSANWVPVEPGVGFSRGAWSLTVDAVDGSLSQVVELASGRVLADPDHRLGLVSYQSFDEDDYERFYAGLRPTPQDEGWARLDNTKPGIRAAGALSGTWHPEFSGAWHATDGDDPQHFLLIRLTFAGSEASWRPGAPPVLWARWSWSTSPDAAERELGLQLWWDAKPANRLPEALWCSFSPVVSEPQRWVMDKLGQPVSPLDVVRHGGRSLHGVGDGGVSYDGPEGSVRIETLDAALMAPGRPNLLDADPPIPAMAGGWHVLLYDNCWGTNFAMWNEGPARFRFRISMA